MRRSSTKKSLLHWWNRCISVGVRPTFSADKTKRVRLFNSVLLPAQVALFVMAIHNLKSGILPPALWELSLVALGRYVNALMKRGKFEVARDISITALGLLILSMHLMYGVTAHTYHFIFPIVGCMFIFYDRKSSISWFWSIGIIACTDIILSLVSQSWWPARVYPVQSIVSRNLDLLISAGMTAASFAWFRSENKLAEARILEEHDILAATNKELKAAKSCLETQAQAMIYSAKMSALGEMGSGMAHEINNPLTVIMGNTMLLKTMLGNPRADADKMKQLCDTITEYSQRINLVVRALRVYSEDDSSHDFAQFSLHGILRDAYTLIKSKCLSAAIDLRLNMEGRDILFRCKSAELSQALLALLNNAIEATREGTGKWIELSLQIQDDSVTISVENNGPTIRKDLQDKIMQPFFTTKKVGEGMGLGLSMAKTMVSHHRGTLDLDIASPHTRFVIKMPRSFSNSSNSQVA